VRNLLFTVVIIGLASLTAMAAGPRIPGQSEDQPARRSRSYTGVSWGAMHTIWNSSWSDEGYPAAGTLGPVISLRRISSTSATMAWVPYISYSILQSNVTESGDSAGNGGGTLRTYFREIDLGLNLQISLSAQHPEWYVGGGPSIRWGQAGRRVNHEPRPGTVRKAAWFGVNALAGYRVDWGKKYAIFFEPQVTFSPDNADRWQHNYPPETVTLQMGILW
jgi:hypothetical protein